MQDLSGSTLTVITGCMFAGKTEELLRYLRREMIAKRKVLLIKPNIDDRYSIDKVVSHSKVELQGVPVDVKHPEIILEMVDGDVQVVGIDEAQFFAPGLVNVCLKLRKMGVKVICAGLKEDFQEDVFGPMGDLLVHADMIIMLTAICMVCGEENATKTQRLIDGEPAPYGSPQILVGGTESYEARCSLHHKVPGMPE